MRVWRTSHDHIFELQVPMNHARISLVQVCQALCYLPHPGKCLCLAIALACAHLRAGWHLNRHYKRIGKQVCLEQTGRRNLSNLVTHSKLQPSQVSMSGQ